MEIFNTFLNQEVLQNVSIYFFVKTDYYRSYTPNNTHIHITLVKKKDTENLKNVHIRILFFVHHQAK